jgi:DNA repair exonuclease SbcCD ATPase subunit
MHQPVGDDTPSSSSLSLAPIQTYFCVECDKDLPSDQFDPVTIEALMPLCKLHEGVMLEEQMEEDDNNEQEAQEPQPKEETKHTNKRKTPDTLPKTNNSKSTKGPTHKCVVCNDTRPASEFHDSLMNRYFFFLCKTCFHNAPHDCKTCETEKKFKHFYPYDIAHGRQTCSSCKKGRMWAMRNRANKEKEASMGTVQTLIDASKFITKQEPVEKERENETIEARLQRQLEEARAERAKIESNEKKLQDALVAAQGLSNKRRCVELLTQDYREIEKTVDSSAKVMDELKKDMDKALEDWKKVATIFDLKRKRKDDIKKHVHTLQAELKAVQRDIDERSNEVDKFKNAHVEAVRKFSEQERQIDFRTVRLKTVEKKLRTEKEKLEEIENTLQKLSPEMTKAMQV